MPSPTINHAELMRQLGGPYAIAKRLRIKPPSVYKWVDKAGRVSIPDYRLIELGADIERVTGGAITRQHLRPDDWRQIWPELAASEPIQPAAPGGQAPAATESVAIGEGADV